jgi:hypothetical protein
MTDPASAVERIGTATTGEEKRDAADEAVSAAVENHEAAEGAESTPSLSARNGLKDALLRTTPDVRLEDVESPWDPERGGINRVYRGLRKALDFEGTPAVVDIVIGVAEFVVAFEPEGGDEEAQQDAGGGEPSEDDVVPLSEVGVA